MSSSRETNRKNVEYRNFAHTRLSNWANQIVIRVLPGRQIAKGVRVLTSALPLPSWHKVNGGYAWKRGLPSSPSAWTAENSEAIALIIENFLFCPSTSKGSVHCIEFPRWLLLRRSHRCFLGRLGERVGCFSQRSVVTGGVGENLETAV